LINRKRQRIAPYRTPHLILHIDPAGLKPIEEKCAGEQGDDDASRPDPEQELAALLIDESDRYQRHDAVQHFTATIAWLRGDAHAACLRMTTRNGRTGIDARGLIQREDDAGEHERDDIFTLQKRALFP